MKSESKLSKFDSYNYENLNFSENDVKSRKTRIIFQLGIVLLATLLFLILIIKTDMLMSKVQQSKRKSPFVLPEAMVGLCNGTCVPNKAYPCIYSTFYPVSFTKDGTWRWDCPFINNSSVEIGEGKIIGTPKIYSDIDGSWRATWYGGNKILSD